MIRFNHYLTPQQGKKLRAVAKQTGLSVAEIVRRLVDKYLEEGEDKAVDEIRVASSSVPRGTGRIKRETDNG
jgi:hypothetical protein